MPSFNPSPLILGLLFVFLLARPAHAFGAGNIATISKVEGQNWRHGDIEDALLKIVMARVAGGKKFGTLDVSRVYFGNWLRDYSQAIDVGTVKSVSAEAVRLLLCVLGFLTFGYGSREFEVTADRLGCYRPEDHIDNPKNYADNEDARRYDERLRAPVDESTELAIDQDTGMKNYIANEKANMMTSARHVRTLFAKSIELGRNYGRSQNKDDLYEALRLLGTGLHCLEDYFAHSNYTELALIELGERDIFPHVGRETMARIPGADHEVYPIVTGTFGGVDFLHSVTGEVSDKLTQNEVQELENTLESGKRSDTSVLKDLLDKLPDGLIGGDKKGKMEEIQNNTAAAQMDQITVSPREPEELTRQIQMIFGQIMPVIEFHDELLKSISEAVESIPVLPQILEQLEEQLSMFVFTQIAPFILPVIRQIKNELMTGSSEIIESSKNEQHIVFEDDHSSDPTHSMLSKDHFTNILNEIAGRTASDVISWVVPQLMAAWDDDNTDVDRLLNRIIYGVLHHPAQRQLGEDGAREGRDIIFRSIEQWWNNMGEDSKNDYRRKLSREGVENGQNHKEGVHDTGHGCGKPLGMHKNFAKGGTMEDRIAGAAAGAILGGLTSGISGAVSSASGGQVKLPQYENKSGSFLDAFSGGGGGRREESGSGGGGREESGSGGGGREESGSSGGLAGMMGDLLGAAFKKDNTESFSSRGVDEEGNRSQSHTEYGRTDSADRYAQAEYKQTEYDDGSQRQEYRRFEQNQDGGGTRYEERQETSYESNQQGSRQGGHHGSRRDDNEEREETSYQSNQQGSRHGGHSGSRRDGDGGGIRYEERQETSYESNQQGSRQGGHHGSRRDDKDNEEQRGGW